jgi:hypothetical protein
VIELTINFVLKFFHIFGLMLGAASGFGSMVVARQMRRAPSPDIAKLRPFFIRLALFGIVLLWITGLGLWMMRYDMAQLGRLYDIKMLVAAILLVIVIFMNMTLRRAQKAGTPPPAWLPKLGMSTPILMLIAMGLGVWVFI